MSTETQSNIDVLKAVLEEEIASPKRGEVKICPCGESFTRPEGASSKSWARMKYCSLHRAMPQHARKKDIERILRKKGCKLGMQTVDLEGNVKNVETKTDGLAAGRDCCTEKSAFTGVRVQLYASSAETSLNNAKSDSGDKPDSALEGVTWKRCAYEACGKIFYKREGMSEGAWSTKKYHCNECKRQAKNARARVKTRERRRERIVSDAACIPEKAQAVADEKWEALAELIAPFVGDVKTLDSMKAACMRIGVECYTQGVQDMGVAV